MIYRVQLERVTYPKGKSYQTKQLGKCLFSDFSRPRDASQFGRAAMEKLNDRQATHFRCDCYNWQKQKWEPVISGSVD